MEAGRVSSIHSVTPSAAGPHREPADCPRLKSDAPPAPRCEPTPLTPQASHTHLTSAVVKTSSGQRYQWRMIWSTCTFPIYFHFILCWTLLHYSEILQSSVSVFHYIYRTAIVMTFELNVWNKIYNTKMSCFRCSWGGSSTREIFLIKTFHLHKCLRSKE